MTTSIELQHQALSALQELRARTKEKLDLIDAGETKGEELDEDSLASDYDQLNDMIGDFIKLDFSFIE